MLLYTRGTIELSNGHKMDDIGSVNVYRVDYIYKGEIEPGGEECTFIVLKNRTELSSTDTVQLLTERINKIKTGDTL